jgi:hypothetical protein
VDRETGTGAKTFRDKVHDARGHLTMLTPEEAKRQIDAGMATGGLRTPAASGARWRPGSAALG